ncbi:hemagglutinin [Mycoavidus sp. B2-EB]|nr:hemagglutinin [Mycoavidus sp. B2-EB]
MLRPIHGIYTQYIRTHSITPDRPEQITPPSNPEADAPTANSTRSNATSAYPELPHFNFVPRGLNSVIKIAGEPAQLIFSNANGMECCGYHFLNSSRIVLTTGEAVLNDDGEVQTFRLKAGEMTIQSRTTLKQYEQIDLIAYSIRIEGEMCANKINISTTQEVNYVEIGLPMSMAQQEVPIISAEAQSNLQRRVQFTSTAKLQAKEELNIQTDRLDNASSQIQSNGNVTLKTSSLTGTGAVIAARDLTAKLEEDYTHKNQLNAGRHLWISTTQRLVNQDNIKTQGDVTLEAKEFENQAKSSIKSVHLKLKADSLKNHGVLQGSNLTIDVQHMVNDGTGSTDEHQAGKIIAERQLTIQAQTLHNQEQGLVYSDDELTIGDIPDTPYKVDGAMQALVNSNSSTIASSKKLSIQAGFLDNEDGQIKAGSELILRSQIFTNRQGRIEAKGDQSVLDVRAKTIDNISGWLLNVGTGKTQIIAQQALGNSNPEAIEGAGIIFGKGPVTIQSPELLNDAGGAIISDQILKIKAPLLAHRLSTLSASRRIEINTNQLTSAGGLIAVGDDEKLKTETSLGVKDLSPYIAHVGVLKVRAQKVINTWHKGKKVQNTLIRVQGRITIKAQAIYNTYQTQILGQRVNLSAVKLFSNSNSAISARDEFTLIAEHFINTHGGSLHSKGGILLEVKELENRTRALIDGRFLTLLLQNQLKNSGVIQGGTIIIDAQNLMNDGENRTDRQPAGAIIARHHLTIGAQALHNQEHGLLRSDGDLSIGDTLDAQHQVKSSMQRLVNSSSSTIESKEKLSIQASQLENKDGHIKAGSELILRSQVVNNRQGRIEAKSDQSVLDIQADAINNISGWLLNTGTGKTRIIAQQALGNFNLAALEGAGIIFGKGPVTIQSPKLVNNVGGAIISDQILKIKTLRLDNKLSTLSASRKIEIKTDKLYNAGGLITVGEEEKFKKETSHHIDSLSRNAPYVGILEVRAKEVVNTWDEVEKVQKTLIRVQGKITIQAQSIYNAHQTQILGQHINLNTEKLFSNSDSTISASDAFTLVAEHFINSEGGNLHSKGDILFKVKELENRARALIDGRFLTLTLQNQLKNSGVIQGSTITISAQNVINDGAHDTDEQQAGVIIARHHLTIGARTLYNQEHGLLHSDGGLSIGDTFDAQHQIKSSMLQLANVSSSTIESKEKLLIQVGQLHNEDGQIKAGSAFILGSKVINNRRGRIEAKGDQSVLDVQAEAIDNLSGWLLNAGTGKTQIITHKIIINSNPEAIEGAGIIFGKGPVIIQPLRLINDIGGSIISDQILEIKAPRLNNRLSTLSARRKIEIKTDKLYNAGGLITVGEEEKFKKETSHHIDSLSRNTPYIGILEVRAKEVVNTWDEVEKVQKTLIRVQGKITIQAQSIYNAHQTQILGQHINLNTKIFANSNSTISARDVFTLMAERFVNFKRANLHSNGDILLEVKELENESESSIEGAYLKLKVKEGWLKNDGVIQASTTALDVQNLTTQEGSLHVQGGLTIEVESFLNSNTGRILAKDLNLNAKTNLINQGGTVSARDTLSLAAQSVINSNKGLLQSDKSLHISATDFGNSGTLHSKDQVLIKSERGLNFRNERQGLVWGKTVSMGAHDRLNGFLVNQSGVIFAQNKLEMGFKEITNLDHGTLYSGGPLTMGGVLDAQLKIQGLSEQVLNHGALIDASGDLTIHANKLLNQNARFEIEERLIEERGIHECHDDQTNQRFDGSQIAWHGDVGGLYRVHSSGHEIFRFINYVFTRRVTTTRVTHSEPGKIHAGGAISLSDQVMNDKSMIIAGGALSDLEGRPAQIENRDAIGQRVTTDQGTLQYSDRKWRGGFKRYFQREWGGHAPYHPAPMVEHHTLTVAVSQPHTAVEHSAPSTALVPSSSALSRNTLLNSGLLHLNTDPNQPYLIQIDPRFTRHSDRVSSDVLLRLLNLDPQHIPKRLGDGFYEQQLIRDQIIGLTGHYYLSSYHNPIAEIRDLMHAGADWAQRFNLMLGIEPTPEQINALTTSPVWLVNQRVQLPDGSEQTVLVPKVYLAPSDAPAIPRSNALISADTIELESDRPFKNTGTVLSRSTTRIRASQIDNARGTLASRGTLSIQTRDDIDSRAGKLIAVKKLTVQAGQNLQLQSQTQTTHAASGSRTHLVGLTQIQAEELEATAGSDLHLAATQIEVEHTARLDAKQDLILGAATTGLQQKIVWDERNALSLSQHTEVGTQIQAGALELKAGRDVTATGAYVKAAEKLAVKARRDIHLEAAYEETDFKESHYHESSHFFGSSSELTRNALYRKQALSSTLSGGTVQIEAGHDLNILGSNVAGMHDVDLYAGNDLQQKAVEQAERTQRYSVQERSGLLESGKFGVTIGTRTQKDAQEKEHTPQIGSVIGSVSGPVRAIAGRDYEQSGSQWVVPTGDIEIRAGQGKIEAAYEQSRVWQRSEWHQSGLTVSVSAPVIAAAQTNRQMLQASTQVSDARMHALAAGAGALAAKNAYDAIKADPKAAGGATVSVMLGEEHSESEQIQLSRTALNSTLAAGGNISIQIGGLGEESTLDLMGARIEAKQNIALNVEGRLKVEAAPNSLIEQSQQHSQSSAVGAVATLGSQSSVGASVALSVGHGRTKGAQINYTPTLIQAGGTLELKAKSDVRLKGAQMVGKQVKAQIEGDLDIDSVQNTARYQSHAQSICGSATAGSVSAASLNVSQRRMDSDYLSVAEQAGIQAGEDGFQISVKGDTKLVGGVMAGSEQAVQKGKNKLITATLHNTDLTNQASYSASSISLGGGYSQSGKGVGSDPSGKAITPAHSGNQLASRGGVSAALPIVMSASGQARSTTRSAISGAEMVITDEARQIELTGHSAAETIADLNRHPAQSHQALAPIFNQAEIEAGFDIVHALGREANTFIVNRAREVDQKLEQAKRIEMAGNEPMPVEQQEALQNMAVELRAQAQALNQQWGPGGLSRRILTALTAAASGNVTGATEQFVQSGVVNLLQQHGAGYVGELVKSGAVNEGSAAHAVLHALVGLGGAAASNQSLGAGALGGAVSSILTHAFSPTRPDETRTEQEAKHNLATTLVAGVAALTGADATVATHSAAAAIDNNWLATEQLVLAQKELDACEDDIVCNAGTMIKWTGVSAKQDALTMSGLISGLAEAGWHDLKGLAEFFKDLPKSLEGLASLVNQEVRDQIGEEIAAEFNAKINRMQVALREGGDQNALQLGRDLGNLIWQIGSIAMGTVGAAQLTASLGKIGVRLGKETAKEFLHVDWVTMGGNFGHNGKPLLDFKQLANMEKSMVGEHFGGKFIQNLLPDAQPIARVGASEKGIDALYKVNKNDIDYVIVEYKYDKSRLSKKTADGPQMSDSWLIGKKTGNDRILKFAGQKEALNITKAWKEGRVEKWLVHTSRHGKVSVSLLDKNAKRIPYNTSKLLGAK